MSRYHRPRIPGTSIFFTVALADRRRDALTREVAVLRRAFRATRAERPFAVDAWVVLPDHMHCVWTLPEGDADYAVRMGAIKARFTRALKRRVGFHPTNAEGSEESGPGMVGWNPTNAEGSEESGSGMVGWNPTLRRSPSKIAKGDGGIWQRRFWEHHIRDEQDYRAHVRYCWVNPVKHGLVERPEDWPYSSYHRDGGVIP